MSNLKVAVGSLQIFIQLITNTVNMVNRGIQILRVSDFNFEKSKCFAMFNFSPNPGPLSFGLGP